MFAFLAGVGFQELIILIPFLVATFLGVFYLLKKVLPTLSRGLIAVFAFLVAVVLSPLIVMGLGIFAYWLFAE